MTAQRTGLNWRAAQHWGGGRRLPCVHCGRGAFCRDETGRPCHKTCAETARTQHGRGAPDDLTTESAA
ncbi:hypothetical protein ACQP1W_36960 [Spirillospora sp. CA-255316]